MKRISLNENYIGLKIIKDSSNSVIYREKLTAEDTAIQDSPSYICYDISSNQVEVVNVNCTVNVIEIFVDANGTLNASGYLEGLDEYANSPALCDADLK